MVKGSNYSAPLEKEGEPCEEDINEEVEEVTQIEAPIEVSASSEPIEETGDYEPQQTEMSTMRIITKIDSPVDIKQVFWSFITKDISMSNITDKDFKYILTNLKLRLYNFIQKYTIENWDNVIFAEYDYKIVPLTDEEGKILIDENGKPMYTQKKMIKNSWDFSELLVDLEEFVYQQLTRGRQGFTFRRLTETFQVSEVKKESGTTQSTKSGWKLW